MGVRNFFGGSRLGGRAAGCPMTAVLWSSDGYESRPIQQADVSGALSVELVGVTQALPSKPAFSGLDLLPREVLGATEKTAKNVQPQLRLLGLIDEDERPTQLAQDWRSDETYGAACGAILDAVYPAELREAVPPDSGDKAGAVRWFMRRGNVGEASAKMMAAFYLLLGEADPSKRTEFVSTS